MDGSQGRVGAPLRVRQQLWYLISLIVESGWASKAVMEKINGFLAFAFQFRRELFCLRHRIYNYVSGMPVGLWLPLPGFVLDELRSLSIHLPYATWNMRRRLSTTVLANDATPIGGGAVTAVAPEALVHELWCRSAVKGAPVRLHRDFSSVGAEEPIEVSEFASAAAECLPWSVCGDTRSGRQVTSIFESAVPSDTRLQRLLAKLMGADMSKCA